MKVFCLPSAGTSASSFNQYGSGLNRDIELIPIDYPGHGLRIKEPLIQDMELLVQFVIDEIQTRICKGEKFIMLGHSLGAMVCYELARYIAEGKDIPNVSKFILCGCPAPNMIVGYLKGISQLDDDSFVERIYQLGGLSDEVRENPFFKIFYLPILRNDFKLIARYEPVLSSFETTTIILSGTEDKLTRSNVLLWKLFAKNLEENILIEGNHFFVNRTEKMCQVLNKVVKI